MAEQQQAQVGILRVYVKDLSFESPGAPGVFNQGFEPEVKLNLQVSHGRIGDGLFEVVLTLTAEARKADKVAFIVEVEQAGLFRIQGVPQENLKYVLEVFCPNVLFPYARQTVDTSLNLGSFPPLMLAPINFEALQQQQQQQVKTSPRPAPTPTQQPQ